MIRVARGPEPIAMKGPRVVQGARELTEFYQQPEILRSQREFQPEDVDDVFFGPLLAMFRGKCAFCEAPLNGDGAVIRFRPLRNAIDLNGHTHPDCYWWLYYAWDNLYPACRECTMRKRTVFPIAGDRAYGVSGAQLRRLERALLIDPCYDRPNTHLVCLDDGQINAISHKGEVTLELFELNRKELVTSRYAAMNETLSLLEMVIQGPAKYAIEEQLWAYIGSSGTASFTIARRHVARKFFNERPEAIHALRQTARVAKLLDLSPSMVRVRLEARTVVARQVMRLPAVVQPAPYSLTQRTNLDRYFIKNHHIRRLEIVNFKAIKQFSIDLQQRSDEMVPWLMLLGENATGKSSVLKAVALALMDSRLRERTGETPSSCLRQGETAGFVRVFLSDRDDPITLQFTATDFVGGADESPVLLMGYGATRLLPTNNASRLRFPTDVVRCENLFSPYASLADASTWLARLPEDKFNDAAIAIKRLLLINDHMMLKREVHQGQVIVTCGGVPLAKLSDGYQATIALAVDIMIIVQQIWEKLRVAQGIVLLDEIDGHLHPRWRMRIVDALREIFPNIQFIVTSHDPLCLRGIRHGESVVMRRDKEGQVHAWTDLPSPDALRVDQLLTSRYFGLHSTVDPKVEQRFETYYDLLAKDNPSDTEQELLTQLQQELHQDKLLGETRREQLMYRAIDEFLAQERRLANPELVEPLEDDLKALLAQIWHDSEARRP